MTYLITYHPSTCVCCTVDGYESTYAMSYEIMCMCMRSGDARDHLKWNHLGRFIWNGVGYMRRESYH